MSTVVREPPHLRLVGPQEGTKVRDEDLGQAALCGRAKPRDEAVERAVNLMRSELETPWTVTRLSRRVGLSRPVFARRFRQAMGESPMRYLARMRLEQAARLLSESTLGLAAVASRVGYQSEFAFNRAFKRLFRIAPGGYRRAMRRSAPLFRMAA